MKGLCPGALSATELKGTHSENAPTHAHTHTPCAANKYTHTHCHAAPNTPLCSGQTALLAVALGASYEKGGHCP